MKHKPVLLSKHITPIHIVMRILYKSFGISTKVEQVLSKIFEGRVFRGRLEINEVLSRNFYEVLRIMYAAGLEVVTNLLLARPARRRLCTHRHKKDSEYKNGCTHKLDHQSFINSTEFSTLPSSDLQMNRRTAIGAMRGLVY
ncbi:hypothetical protein Scep_016835 [Stephania cephalantha]|uniref:Uncharacterized protein n=1 Tax=Stephania cephalantha TaxID=152367 RepID=A0AAP0IQD0_9MAGN